MADYPQDPPDRRDRRTRDTTPDPDAKDDPKEPAEVTKDDEILLEELRERFDYALTQWAPIIEEGNKDVRYVSGDTWDEDDRRLRKGRPVLNLDQLSQYLNQLVNSFRQNPRAAKASPAGDGATAKTAELRANRIREIEYQSHAQEAYTVAGENAATRGYGYCRIVAEYEDSTSDNQVLRIKAIPNPNQVLPDPDAESTAGVDWRYLFFVHSVSHAEFRRDYPDAQVKDFTAGDLLTLYPKWIQANRVQIAEYWRVTETPSPKGRPTRTVCQYVTNGVELLAKAGQSKKTEWRGSTIPFASCYGKILYTVDGDATTKVIQSYIRLARDAAKYYNWIKSTAGEVLSMVPKSALFAYEGQFSPENLDLVVRSTYEPVPVIFAKAQMDATGQTVLPLPQRNLPDPPIQAYEMAAESARRDIQNALGRYSAQDARMGGTKVTSGRALQELEKSGDLGSYHHQAHYDDMIRAMAMQLDELLPFYDDTDKEVAVRLPDGTPKMQQINRMTGRGQNGGPAYAADDLRMDQGRHTITISTGPSFDSQREQAKDAAMSLLSNPQAFPFIASDSIRLMDLGPIGDQMAKDLEFLQPPAMQQARQQEQQGGGPNPQQLQQENGQLKQQLEQLNGIAKEMDSQLKGKQEEIAAKVHIAKLEAEAADALQVKLQTMKDATAIAIAHITAASKGLALNAHAEEEALALGHEATQADLQRQHAQQVEAAKQQHAQQLAQQGQQHAAGLAAAGAGSQADEAEAARQHAQQMGAEGHQQNLEAQQQQADLQPAPVDPGSAE